MKFSLENHFSKPGGSGEAFFYLYPAFHVHPPFTAEVDLAGQILNRIVAFISVPLVCLVCGKKEFLWCYTSSLYWLCKSLCSTSCSFFSPPFPSGDCWYPAVCVCWLYQPSCCDTPTHTQGWPPTHPSQTDTGRARHDIQTAPRAMRWRASTFVFPSRGVHTCIHAHTHSCAVWHVREASTQTHMVQWHQNLPATHSCGRY